MAKTKLEDRQEAQERILTEGCLKISLETSDDRSLPSCHRQVDRFFYRLSIVQMFLQRLHRGRRMGYFRPGAVQSSRLAQHYSKFITRDSVAQNRL